MGYTATVLAHSEWEHGPPLITMQVTFPRFILAEFNTHRVLSRNSASSRAIPVAKRIQQVVDDPFIPETFGRNGKGMQAHELLEGEMAEAAENTWREACGAATYLASLLAELGVHKQLANRLLEPFAWHTVIVSGTEWSNFYNLRCHPDAQPEFRKIALLMRDVHKASKPQRLDRGEWHLPLVTDEDRRELHDGPVMRALVSAARCARVSYLTHEGKRDIAADLALAARLISAGHMSPFEHPAQACMLTTSSSNFYNWTQYRKYIACEDNPLG